jgi:uncharacterized OsmC-like protein
VTFIQRVTADFKIDGSPALEDGEGLTSEQWHGTLSLQSFWILVGAVPKFLSMGEENAVVVRGTRADGFRHSIRARQHTLTADEPASLGGTDQGPTPYDLLLAALGSCTAMTVRMYANRRGWPLEDVAVRLVHDRIHARDCEHCETQEGMLDHITLAIEMTGALTPEQRARLLDIAHRCPVHKTLKSEIAMKVHATGGT